VSSPLKMNRKIILFILSQTVSLLGSALVQYAIVWHITLETQSGAMLTIAILCGFLPTFFLSPYAGVWADRYNRKNLIALADAMIAVFTLLLAILFMNGQRMMWLLFAVSAMRSIGSAIQTPAVNALIPQLVPEGQLMKVNGINGSIQSIVALGAPFLSFLLMTMMSIEIVFFIDVITAAIAIAILMFYLRVPTHEGAGRQKASYFKEIREGLSYIGGQPYLKAFFAFSALFYILFAPCAFLTTLQVTRVFGDDEWRLLAIEVTFSIGMMIGGGIMTLWGGFKNRARTMAVAMSLFGVGTLLLGVVPSLGGHTGLPVAFWIYAGVMALLGIVMPAFNIPSTVVLQERVDAAFHGRIFSIMSMISGIMMPLGMLVFGPLADVVEIEWMLLVTGVLICVEGVLLFGNRPLRAVGQPMEKVNALAGPIEYAAE